MSKYRYKKSFRAKKKKFLLKNRFFRLALLFLFGVGFLFYFFLFSSFFRIEKIEILGNEKIPTKEIEDIVGKKTKGFFSGNILFFKSKETEEAIFQKFILAKKINFKKNLFSKKIVVEIEERIPFALWCSSFGFDSEKNNGQADLSKENKKTSQKKEDYCLDIDKEGIAFEKSGEKAGLIVNLEKKAKIGDKIIKKEYLKNISEIYKETERKLKLKIKSFFISDKNKLTAKTFEGWEIYFNPKGDISDQLFNLKLVLEKQISSEKRKKLEYIDLRFGNRVFYK